MKEHTGDQIRAIMEAMPAEGVHALQAEFPEHKITEQEARWWGYLNFARTECYEGTSFVIPVNGKDEGITWDFLNYTLTGRKADQVAGLVRKPWPESGYFKL